MYTCIYTSILPTKGSYTVCVHLYIHQYFANQRELHCMCTPVYTPVFCQPKGATLYVYTCIYTSILPTKGSYTVCVHLYIHQYFANQRELHCMCTCLCCTACSIPYILVHNFEKKHQLASYTRSSKGRSSHLAIQFQYAIMCSVSFFHSCTSLALPPALPLPFPLPPSLPTFIPLLRVGNAW